MNVPNSHLLGWALLAKVSLAGPLTWSYETFLSIDTVPFIAISFTD